MSLSEIVGVAVTLGIVLNCCNVVFLPAQGKQQLPHDIQISKKSQL